MQITPFIVDYWKKVARHVYVYDNGSDDGWDIHYSFSDEKYRNDMEKDYEKHKQIKELLI